MKKKGNRKKIWKRLLCILICIILVPVLIPALLALVLCLPPVQRKVIDKAQEMLYEKTGIDASIGSVSFKAPYDLSLNDILALDSNSDTLLSVGKMDLDVNLHALLDSVINVEGFKLEKVILDTHDKIPGTCIRARVNKADLRSDYTSVLDRYTRLNRLEINGADIEIISNTSDSNDTTSLGWKLDLDEADLSDIKFAMPAQEVELGFGKVHTKLHIDTGNKQYKADTLELHDAFIKVSRQSLILENLSTAADFSGSLLDINGMSARTGGIDLTLSGKADLEKIKQTITYDADIEMHDFRIEDFIDIGQQCLANGTLSVSGHGIDPFSKNTQIHVSANLTNAQWQSARLDTTMLEANINAGKFKGSLQTSGGWFSEDMNISSKADAIFNASQLTSGMPVFEAQVALTGTDYSKDGKELHLEPVQLTAGSNRERTHVDLSSQDFHTEIEADGHITPLIASLSKLSGILPDLIDTIDLEDLKHARPIRIIGTDIDSLRQFYPTIDIKAHANSQTLSMLMPESRRWGFGVADIVTSLSPEHGIKANLKAEDLYMDTLELKSVKLDLAQKKEKIDLNAELLVPSQQGLPDIDATVDGWLASDNADLRVIAHTAIDNGIMSLNDISAGIDLNVRTILTNGIIKADGNVNMANLIYEGHSFENRNISAKLTPEAEKGYALSVNTDEIPIQLLNSYLNRDDISIAGAVSASLFANGPLDNLDISGNAQTHGITFKYLPMDVNMAIADNTVTVKDMNVMLNDMEVYSIDSTLAIIDGGVNLRDRTIGLDITSDRFIPVPLNKADSASYYGTVATALDLKLEGKFDSLCINGNIGVLPETDVIYLFGKNNYVNADVSGNLQLDYPLSSEPKLYGKLNIDGGEAKYTLPFYPLLPFSLDKGSYVKFDGDVKDPDFDITASQKAKALFSETGDRARNVNFIVGLQVEGSLSNPELHFLCQAPEDAQIQNDINAMSVDERDRIAAALLATGMYTAENNVMTGSSDYALTSIMQRGLNTIAGNRLGNIVDIDLGIAGNNSMTSARTDYSMKLSKSFFDDRLKLTVGGRLSHTEMYDESKSSTAMLDNLSAEYLLDKEHGTSIELFHKYDFDNIVEGEIIKDGIGVKTHFEMNDRKGTSYPYILDLQGDLSYRNIMQIGPNLSATISKYNLLGLDETLSMRLLGAYYWPIISKVEGGHVSYNFGADISMSTPSLWGNQTLYNIGYLNEMIGDLKSMHKISLSASHRFIRSRYVTHQFTPFSLSLVMAGNRGYLSEIDNIHTFISEAIKEEYIPAISYRFTYDNTMDRNRRVNTMFSIHLKESGNLIDGLQVLTGADFNKKGKEFLLGTYDQFLKGTAELHNRFKIGERSQLATRLITGINYCLGNSDESPTSESFYAGGPSSIRAFAPRSIGPGAYYSDIYTYNFYHSGDLRGEFNIEYRFPLFWLLEGAAFIDAGNVWKLKNTAEDLTEEDKWFLDIMQVPYNQTDGFEWNSMFRTMALGTGFGIRLVYQSIVIRLDTGIALHYPYDTGVNSYYNVPNFWKDGIRLNFGIGYPF